MKVLMTSVAVASLLATVPAIAEDSWKEKQRDQLLYQEQLKMQQEQGQAEPGAEGAIGATKPNSGPGIQGPPGTRTGPAAKAPGEAAGAPSDSGSAGASSGEAGQSGGAAGETQPSQDSSGVQGFPDTRTGPATKQPSDMDNSGSQ